MGMLRRLRRHLSFANVCSFIALTVALGTGGAYAANTVFSADIVDGEVKTPDIATGAVTAFKIAPESLSSGRIFGLDGSDVDDDGLTGADVKESSLARVPDAAKLGGVAARPVVHTVKPAATDHDACGNPQQDGTFCSVEVPGNTFYPAYHQYGDGFQAVRFYRDVFNVVHIEGLAAENGNFGPEIFHLPAGWRPAARHVFSAIGQEESSSRPSVGRVDVSPDGRVTLESPPDTNDSDFEQLSYLSLDGISFLAA